LSQQRRRPRVLLADDYAGLHASISRLLSPTCDMVGCVSDSATLLEATGRLRPDVVLLDLSLPGGLNILEVCRRIKATTPEVNVVVFTATDDPDLRRLAYEAGASDFVWKLNVQTDLVAAIQRAFDGKTRPDGDSIV
jgi:two-component system response regulator NreC